MKLLKYVMACLLCLGALTIAASAASQAGEAAAVAGFYQEDKFYAFVSMEGEWPDTVTAKAQLDGKAQAFSMEETPVPLEAGGAPVSYLLLVDRSGSMCGTRRKIDPHNLVDSFAGALYDAAGGNAKFAVATFDESFNEEGADFTDNRHAFLEDMESIQYNAQKTDLTESVLDAIDYLEGYQRETGELVNLILVSDGIPDGGENRMAPSAAAGRIDASPSILFHTFGIGTSDPESPASLDSLAQLGRGAHTAVLNNRRREAEDAARETAAFVNGIYSLQFPLGRTQSEAADAFIYFYDQMLQDGSSERMFTKLAGVPVLSSTGEVISRSEPEPAESVDTPDAETPEEAPADENASDSREEPESNGDADEPPEENNEASSDAAAAGSPSGGGVGQSAQESGKLLPVILVFAVIAVLAALMGVYLVFRRKRSVSETAHSEEIYMRLEVISGQLSTKKREFYLTDELIIGKARSCDLVLKEPGIAKHCARIYLSDHIIWIEDIGASNGVYLGGMRIYNANRLRSGDEISIGNTRFHFKF